MPINLGSVSKEKGSNSQITVKDLMVCVFAQVKSMLRKDVDRSKLYFTTEDRYFLPPTASLEATIFKEPVDQSKSVNPATEPVLLLTTQELNNFKPSQSSPLDLFKPEINVNKRN